MRAGRTSLIFEGGGGDEAEDPSSRMEMTVDEDAASRPPRDDDARSKLASSTDAVETLTTAAAAGGVVAFSLDDDVVASSSSKEGQDGVDSSILLRRSFKALKNSDLKSSNAIFINTCGMCNTKIQNNAKHDQLSLQEESKNKMCRENHWQPLSR